MFVVSKKQCSSVQIVVRIYSINKLNNTAMTSKEFKNQAWKSTTTVKVADWDSHLRVTGVDFDGECITAEDGNIYVAEDIEEAIN
jgi:hypothetical protein